MNFLDNLVDIRTKELDLDNKELLARAHFLSLGFVKTEDKDEYKYINNKFGVEFRIYVDDVEIYLTAFYRDKVGSLRTVSSKYNNNNKYNNCVFKSNFHDYDSKQVEQILQEIIKKCEYGRKELIS